MSALNLSTHENIGGNERYVTATFNTVGLMQETQQEVFKQIIKNLSKRVADDIYADVIKAVDKDMIIKEVSLKVSENILDKMFGDKK